MVNMEEFRKAQRAEGPATIMAIGTATPPNCVLQSTYPDYYFRVTKSEHKKELKEKFKRMCDKTMIKKRYTYLTEEILKEKPNISAHMAPSLDERLNVALVEIPKLGAEAATRAIKEWGQPKSKITHLVFSSTCAVEMPGADFHIIELLGLDPCVKRVPLIQQGCHSGAIALRIAKDLAENNKGARVLLICSENTVVIFRGPDETLLDNLIGQALFGDGAVSLLIGSDPLSDIEKPLFEIISASQTIIPDSKLAITAELSEAGVNFHLQRDVPELIAKNIEKIVAKSFQPFGVVDWNSLFWVSHPGGAAILDRIEETLHLTPDKLRVSRHVLSEYGNMSSPSVLFALNEMRLSSARDGFHTTGEGLDWGVLIGFGPGITVEALVLRSMSI